MNEMTIQNNYYELEPENNHFYTIFADITHKCNMNCNNCYIPNRNIPDMDKLKLFNLMEKLPKKCEIRLIGAEPTMRNDLPEIIFKTRSFNHRPILITNGLKLSNLEYVKILKKAGLSVVAISLNGGSNENLYKKIDGGAFGEKKMKALKNLADMNFFINTNTIIVKGVNENVPMEIYRKLKDLNVKRAIIRFKNIGELGRYMKPSKGNYSYQELIQLISDIFGLRKSWILEQNIVNGYEEQDTVFFPIEKSSKRLFYIKITDWSNLSYSERRGRVTENFKIAPFFKHVELNEWGY